MGFSKHSTKFVPHWWYGDTFDIGPKLGGVFELRPTSFQNLL